MDKLPLEERNGFFDLSVTQESDHAPPPLPLSQLFEEPSPLDKENDTQNDIPQIQIEQPKGHVTFRVNEDQASMKRQEDSPTLTIPASPSYQQRLLDYLHKKFPSRIVRRVLKCTLAYFLTTLFSLIHPLTIAIGTAAFLTTSGSVFNHPGRSMGAQIDATVTSVLGIILAVLWAFAALGAGSSYNQTHLETHYEDPVGKVIPGLFLFIGVFLAQMLRQVLPKFYFFSLQFMIVQIFSMTRGVFETSMNWQLPLTFGLPLLIGATISLVVNLVVWPETAVDGLGRALQETIKASQNMLQMITQQFFLDPQSEMLPEDDVNALAASMRLGMTKVKGAYREAKYEVSYAYVRPQEMGDIRKTLDRLTKHLGILGGCLKTERELFEGALEALEREYSDDEDSDDDADDDNNDSATDDEHEVNHGSQKQRSLPSSRHTYSGLDADLLRAALRATNDFTQPGARYSASANTSPRSSRGPSRATSRATSRTTSRRNSMDEDYTEENQKSIASIKSFLSLPKKKVSTNNKLPRKCKKKVNFSDRHLLMIYLESLRDPLMILAMKCTQVLACAGTSVTTELDLDDEDDTSIRKTWLTYLRHLFKLKKKTTGGEGNKVSASSTEDNDHGKCQPETHQCHCASTMQSAVKEFDISERKCMDNLYRYKEEQLKAGGGTLDLGMREELFLVFFFMFTLREAANELETLSKELDTLRQYSKKRMVNGKRRKHLYMPQMTQKWWKKWAHWNNHQSTKDKGGQSFASLTQHMPDEHQPAEMEEEYRLTRLSTTASIKRELSRRPSHVPLSSSPNGSIISLTRTPTNRSSHRRQPSKSEQQQQQHFMSEISRQKTLEYDIFNMAEEGKKQEDTKKEKPPLSLRLRYSLWKALQYTKRYEFKFSLKMAVAVLVLCMPAFFPSSSAWYQSVRGQWSGMTVIAIMNPTSGGTLQASFWRIVGTLVGALMGWAALEAGGGSPYVLAVFAVLLAIPFYYLHLGSTYNKVGTVVLIAYMVVALSRYAYPVPGESIASTVWKRVLTMIVGIVVALLLNSVVWPFVARQAVRKSIPGVLNELADYFTFLMGTFLYHLPETPPSLDDIKRSIKMENKIQESIDACNRLLDLTDNEPRMRGPFPKSFYKAMTNTMQELLDRMASIRVALFKMSPVVKKNICQHEYYVFRRDMIASVLLHFFTLSSALRSKTPLPIYMPSARSARMRLLANQQKTNDGERFVNFRNLTWFAVACCTEEIIGQLEHLTDLVRFIVGDAKYAEQARRMDSILS
ncbi:uncharacterized protein BX664DRAFT_323411 [Halteromyces radiatus]|uniref:uncharacterized protein n=1 Tax=Halteromyces radiatus TaxID=101107 RepID=UPI00221F8D0F|nr:uncharacterized protein BX664DRAFT_323411 [Halteromyces radiatus]KAI8096222.1 hypothetical protein BX664DRAFT_323411 [Halteromyces radiatus]